MPSTSVSMPSKATVRLKSFADASNEQRAGTATASETGPRVHSNGAPSGSGAGIVSTRAYPSLSTLRFHPFARSAPHARSVQDVFDEVNAQSIAATNPVLISPRAYMERVAGRGPIELSVLSAQGVQLPPKGESPFDWAAKNGITISWDHSGGMNGGAGAEAKQIIVSSQLLNQPRQVLWFVMFHEIGHVLAGHSENQPKPSPVRVARELDADKYAAHAMTVADPSVDRLNKTLIHHWLCTVSGDAEHKSGVERGADLMRTVATAANGASSSTFAVVS